MLKLVVLAVVGLFAQLVDGSLGMGYGVTSSSMLLTVGIAPAAASAAVHLSEVGTTLISGAAHSRFGNVDWRIVSILAIPGGIGAFVGANFLVALPAATARPWIALLLMSLGIFVLWRFLVLAGARPQFGGRLPAVFLAPLGLVAGTIDAVGGGGWGPVGTTSLLSTGRIEPRKVIGSVSASEFVVAVAASIGFLTALGAQGINLAWVVALLAGGVVAAPLAAWFVRRLAPRVLGVAAGVLIILTNTKSLLETWFGVAPTSPVLWGTMAAVLVGGSVLIVRAVRLERHQRDAVAVADTLPAPAGDPIAPMAAPATGPSEAAHLDR